MLRSQKNGPGPWLSRLHIAIWVIGAFLATVAGPFGTYHDGEAGTRYVFWLLVFVISSGVAYVGNQMGLRIFGLDRPALIEATKLATVSIVFTPILYGLTGVFVPTEDGERSGFLVLFLSVFAITFSICIIRWYLPNFGFNRATTRPVVELDEPERPQVQEPRLARRLPDSYKGPILRLAVRDHSVDVVTEAATHTIRHRFADAVDEMEPVKGFCTHRSHWVAQEAAVGLERDNGRIFLRIVNQDLVPVSRKYRPDVERAGFV